VNTWVRIAAGVFVCALSLGLARSQNPLPWMDKRLSPDQRAELLIGQMTLDEKIALIHGGTDYQGPESPVPPDSLGGAGWVPGNRRLGIPDLQMTDGRSGIANTGHLGRYATALPSPLMAAASWDLGVAYDFGALIGKEARDLGFNVSLGGTANLVREPRNGRNFECLSEDPILVGKMLGRILQGTQSEGVIGNINRYALNDEETGRTTANVIIDERSMRETDLLAFEIAIRESDVGTVMCSYNQVNGVYACESDYLLHDVLKNAWGFQGWVLTDWGANHSAVKAARAGLDQEMPTGKYFDALKAAAQSGELPMSRLNDMAHRILRTMFAFGAFDNPPAPHPVDPFAGAEVAQRVAERGIVLLKNAGNALPLDVSALRSIAVIGSHADVGVLSGWGSNKVDAAGGNPVPESRMMWHRSSPLKSIRGRAPRLDIRYDPGADADAAAKLAAGADVAIVFVHQHTSEGDDAPDLSLPDKQDLLVSAVAAANRRTVVVLETGGPVTMPWIDSVSAALEAWYPGIRGAQAITAVLFGDVVPSGKLPVTFPRSEADLPRAPVPPAQSGALGLRYSEGVKVGYKWFDAERKKPLFPFGFGLSYCSFYYSGLRVAPAETSAVTFTVTNAGRYAATEIAQVYVSLPAAAEPKRLVAWGTVHLAPGASGALTLPVDRLSLSIFNVERHAWELMPGEYTFYAGGSSADTPLHAAVQLAASSSPEPRAGGLGQRE